MRANLLGQELLQPSNRKPFDRVVHDPSCLHDDACPEACSRPLDLLPDTARTLKPMLNPSGSGTSCSRVNRFPIVAGPVGCSARLGPRHLLTGQHSSKCRFYMGISARGGRGSRSVQPQADQGVPLCLCDAGFAPSPCVVV